MLEELDKLINFIQKEYLEFNKIWKQSIYYSEIKQKDSVYKLLGNNDKIENIFNYREFLNQYNIKLAMNLKEFNTNNSEISNRVKLRNSIEQKIKNYIESPKHNNGKVPINKCLNDLYGIRIVMKQKPNYTEIENLINNKYEKIKCIEAIREGYIATHIYFRDGNLNFQWELQIWNKSDEINNKLSHEKYKQDYIKWEKENKGGKR